MYLVITVIAGQIKALFLSQKHHLKSRFTTTMMRIEQILIVQVFFSISHKLWCLFQDIHIVCPLLCSLALE